MEIHYKGITNERTEDAPFVGALVCAMDCHFNCPGCFNQHMREAATPAYVNTAEEIVAKIKDDPFNEGIILGGLEWSLQPLELIELVTVASKAGLKVMIYTGCALEELHDIIGRACVESTGNSELVSKYVLSESDSGIYGFMGAMMLDTVITSDYYIKCGKYDENDLAADRKPFGVNLASNNQTIYQFRQYKNMEEIKNG